MDSLAERHLKRTIHFEDVAGKGAKQLTFNQVALEQAGPYAAEDADVTLRLHRCLWPRLEREPGLRRLYEELEIPLIDVLARMERIGVRWTRRHCASKAVNSPNGCGSWNSKPTIWLGTFNLGSPETIAGDFVRATGIAIRQENRDRSGIHRRGRVAGTGAELSVTESDFGAPLAEQVEIDLYRSATRADSSAYRPGPYLLSSGGGQHRPLVVFRSQFAEHPDPHSEGRRIRQAFVPEPGWVMLAADYSQIELRIMAHLSGDDGLLRFRRRASTCIAPPPLRCSAWRWRMSAPSSDVAPRPSISG